MGCNYPNLSKTEKQNSAKNEFNFFFSAATALSYCNGNFKYFGQCIRNSTRVNDCHFIQKYYILTTYD